MSSGFSSEIGAGLSSAVGSIRMGNWNGLDWVLVALLALSTLRGAMRGLVSALFGLAGLVAGFEIAMRNYLAAADWMVARGYVSPVATARLLAFPLIAAMVLAGFAVAGSAVKKAAHGAGLGLFDRLLGSIFGLARGVVMAVVLLAGVSAVGSQFGWVERSRLSPYFLGAAHAVSFVVPHDLH